MSQEAPEGNQAQAEEVSQGNVEAHESQHENISEATNEAPTNEIQPEDMHDPPAASDEPPAKEAVVEIPQEKITIPEEVVNKITTPAAAEANAVENE